MEGDAGPGRLTPTPPLTADESPDPELSDHVDDAGTAPDLAPESDSRLSGTRLNWVLAGIALAALLLTPTNQTRSSPSCSDLTKP